MPIPGYYLTEVATPITPQIGMLPSSRPVHGLYVDAFAEATRNLVQWLEDVGHQARIEDSLVLIMKREFQFFMSNVASHYHEPQEPVVQTTESYGALSFHVDMSGRLQTILIEREPFLYAALNTPDGLCACQAVPGVQHSHD